MPPDLPRVCLPPPHHTNLPPSMVQKCKHTKRILILQRPGIVHVLVLVVLVQLKITDLNDEVP